MPLCWEAQLAMPASNTPFAFELYRQPKHAVPARQSSAREQWLHQSRHRPLLPALTSEHDEQFPSQRSFAFALAVVCHCMFEGASAPQQDNGQMWSTTYPRQAPVVAPVAGQGWVARKALTWYRLLTILPRWSRSSRQTGAAVSKARTRSPTVMTGATQSKPPARSNPASRGGASPAGMGCFASAGLAPT
jgi:hypothetical protein